MLGQSEQNYFLTLWPILAYFRTFRSCPKLWAWHVTNCKFPQLWRFFEDFNGGSELLRVKDLGVMWHWVFHNMLNLIFFIFRQIKLVLKAPLFMSMSCLSFGSFNTSQRSHYILCNTYCNSRQYIVFCHCCFKIYISRVIYIIYRYTIAFYLSKHITCDINRLIGSVIQYIRVHLQWNLWRPYS